MSQPPYPYGNPQDPANQPPSDPFQTAGYPPPFPDPAYPDPAYQPATYPVPTQQSPYPPTQPYQPGPYQGYPGQPTYPGYPVAPPPPPRRGATVAIVTVVALLLVLVVGGGIAAAYLIPKDKPNTQGSGSPAPPVSQSPSAVSNSPTPAPGPTHSGDLRALLVAQPSGVSKCSNEEGTDGALDLGQAANLSSDPTKRAAELQQYKFTGGAVRCWVTGDKTVVDVRLYQFDSTTNARGFFDADLRGTSPGYTKDNITAVSGVPDGQSFTNPNKDTNGYARAISIGVRGDVVLVVALAQIPPVKVSIAENLLVQQYQKL